MKILIIGSEGFIGNNAVRYFCKKGYEVYSADIVIKIAENYTAINPEFPDFARLFYKHQFDLCINASGAANVQFSFKHAALDYTLNVSNVFHILEAIRQYNPCCKFITFSSAAVYGNPETLPIKESVTLNPLSPYGWHKVQSEQICKEFNLFFNLQTLSFRVFSAYGPGLKKQLFWDLYQKSLISDDVSIYGTGNESRDFIYIDDLLKAVELSLNQATFQGETINLANGEELFLIDIVDLYFKKLNKRYHFSGEIKKGDPLNWKADISKIIEWGYKKTTELNEGLNKYLLWLKKSV